MFCLLFLQLIIELNNEQLLQTLTDNRKSCGPRSGRCTFITDVSSCIRLLYVVYGQDSSEVVDSLHKSLIKPFLVSTSVVEYENRTVWLALIFPVDV